MCNIDAVSIPPASFLNYVGALVVIMSVKNIYRTFVLLTVYQITKLMALTEIEECMSSFSAGKI